MYLVLLTQSNRSDDRTRYPHLPSRTSSRSALQSCSSVDHLTLNVLLTRLSFRPLSFLLSLLFSKGGLIMCIPAHLHSTCDDD